MNTAEERKWATQIVGVSMAGGGGTTEAIDRALKGYPLALAVVEAAEGIDWRKLADELDERVGHGPDLPDHLRLLAADVDAWKEAQ